MISGKAGCGKGGARISGDEIEAESVYEPDKPTFTPKERAD